MPPHSCGKRKNYRTKTTFSAIGKRMTESYFAFKQKYNTAKHHFDLISGLGRGQLVRTKHDKTKSNSNLPVLLCLFE